MLTEQDLKIVVFNNTIEKALDKNLFWAPKSRTAVKSQIHLNI